MSRPRTYATAADRQRAYRSRLAARLAGATTNPLPRPTRHPSRPARLATVVASLRALQEEYQTWLDSIPESLADGDLAGKLQETIEQLGDVTDQLADIELPRGFGRD
jgi:hypothetical protein